MERFELSMLSHLGLNQAPIPIRVHLHTGESLVLQNPQIYEALLDYLPAPASLVQPSTFTQYNLYAVSAVGMEGD